ncbi:flavin reductase family protein [Streptomyces hebeiensis]
MTITTTRSDEGTPHGFTASSFASLSLATKGENKFDYGKFEFDEAGHPLLSDAATVIRCELEQAVPGGDHVILIGRAHDAGQATASR